LTKQDCINALTKTQSVKAAARFSGVSYQHFRKWCKLYKDKESGLTLLEKYKNPSGKGIKKFFGGGDEPYLLDIIEGRVDASYFTAARIKERMLNEGYLKDECKRCKFNEKRIIDGKIPLLFHFEDGNKRNYNLNNVGLLCYNCYFLTIGNIFSNKDIDSIEDYARINSNKINDNWELDEYHINKLKELGLMDNEINKDYIDNI
jgi:hypothetical protein